MRLQVIGVVAGGVCLHSVQSSRLRGMSQSIKGVMQLAVDRFSYISFLGMGKVESKKSALPEKRAGFANTAY